VNLFQTPATTTVPDTTGKVTMDPVLSIEAAHGDGNLTQFRFIFCLHHT